MKPYGLDGIYPIAPDCGDIAEFGLKSSLSRVRSKSGDIKNSFRNTTAKRQTRRTYKRIARQSGKRLCQNEREE